MTKVQGYVPHPVYWYGKYYAAGSASIPSDLAIALGLPLPGAATNEVVPPTVAGLTPPVPPVVDPATRKTTPPKQ